jgi:CheY-like chemotaxis protein
MHELPPILVAEDDEDDFLFLRRAIRQAAIENPILRFRDGSELVKFLQQIPRDEAHSSAQTPWLLLLDITMPIMNGFEVLQWLSTHKDLPRVQPVMLSGSYRTEDIQRAMSLGATDYLMKPISAPVAAALATRQFAPAAR